METREESRARQTREHVAKFEALAQWLGVDALKKLVPRSREQILGALAAGDEHLNMWGLQPWDNQHGVEPVLGENGWRTSNMPKTCRCCGQVIPVPPADRAAGVWGLVRAAIARDRAKGIAPSLVNGWSLSDTGCVLKHVARHHIAKESV